MYKIYSELGRMYDVGDIGSINVQPFKNSKNKKLQEETWTMRLLNAGELLDVHETIRSLAGNPHDDELQSRKIELLIRSLVARNGVPLVSADAVNEYNKNNKTNLTRLEVARIEARNLEQYVLNTFDTQYGILMNKQRNLIEGMVVCQNCGSVLPIEEEDIPMVENIDEIAHCPQCPNREKVIEDISNNLKKGNVKDIVGEFSHEDVDVDLGE